MSTIVGSFGTGHILLRRHSAGEAGERAYQGMRELGRRIAALKPDVVVIVSSDHFYNYHGNEPATFAIGTEADFESYGDMDIPPRTIAGSSVLAEAIIARAEKEGFPLERLASSYKPDHGVVLPYLMIDKPRPAIIPIIINLHQAPTMKQGWDLGEIIRRVVEERVSDKQRIVVVGTGGLSHWLGVPEMGRVNPEFDAEVMDTIVAGDAVKLTEWTTEYIVEHGGNGGLEIVNWAVMAGALPGARGKRLYYEELPEWLTGLGGVQLYAEIGEK
tara:strand:+ start:15846 stop:16664 length:819 start_codon:yes stop_codon:yes gene_type:complete